MLNVAVSGQTADSYLTVYPSGAAMPSPPTSTSSRGATVADLVMAKVGTGGTVSIYNAAGSVQIIDDVACWVS